MTGNSSCTITHHPLAAGNRTPCANMPLLISANISYTLDLLPRSGRAADKEMAPYSYLPPAA
jgi:hypothetical protein